MTQGMCVTVRHDTGFVCMTERHNTAWATMRQDTGGVFMYN